MQENLWIQGLIWAPGGQWVNPVFTAVWKAGSLSFAIWDSGDSSSPSNGRYTGKSSLFGIHNYSDCPCTKDPFPTFMSLFMLNNFIFPLLAARRKAVFKVLALMSKCSTDVSWKNKLDIQAGFSLVTSFLRGTFWMDSCPFWMDSCPCFQMSL